nr:histidine kinase [uncultured Carboxylicivirga sp.]
MYKILFNKRNVIALVVLVVMFTFGTYWIRAKMHQQYQLVSLSVIHGTTKGYQEFLDSYFDSYRKVLFQIDQLWQISDDGEKNQIVLKTLLDMDSTIVAVAVLDQTELLAVYDDSVIANLPDLSLLLKSDSINNQHSCIVNQRFLFVGDRMSNTSVYGRGILVDLHRLHQKFIKDNVYTSVYQVLINQCGQCIYHPEIEMVGKDYPLPNYLFSNGSYNYHQFDTLHLDQSDYLQLSVYKEYRTMSFMGNEWVVINVSPGFEIKDMIAEQERNMVLLFVLFLGILLGILMFGILHWKREFLLRSSAEQENLNLLLKNEKQKSETISIKLELLRSGLNSHFMFNSLGTVKALISNEDKTAREMLKKLSQLYRYQLRIEGEIMVTLRDELTFTQTYVDVINIRMNSSIQMDITNLDDYLNTKVLPVSLQLLVENCIKHNVASEANPLLITITIKDDRIYVVNELRPKVALVETNGKGLNNLNTRYMLISQQECSFKKQGGSFIASIPLIKA